MTDLWYPNAIINEAPKELWGSYRDDDQQWKYLLHTTESDAFRPNKNNYFGNTNYPHATAYLPAGESVGSLYQHIPINRAARALKNKPGGVETNADRVVQIEIVGRASNAPNFPKALLDVVRDFGLWVAEQTGMPWQSSVKFVAGGAGVRLGGSAFDNYAGILGHQHAPENDHVDPGAINISYILNGPAQPEPVPTPSTPEEIGMDFFILNDNNAQTADQWYWWPELGGEKGTKAIAPSSAAVTKARSSKKFCGDLELDRPDLDAIPTLR